MTDTLDLAGSFALIWLLAWLAGLLLLTWIYPLLRRRLLRGHPALAGNLLLLLLAFPLLCSLSSTAFLFSPAGIDVLVSEHCHAACQAHLPLLGNYWLSLAGLGLGLLAAGLLLSWGLRQFLSARRLMRQLTGLSEEHEHWHVLPDASALVFALGWWRSRIFLTQGLLNTCQPADIEIILAHEQAHVRRLDNLRVVLGRLFLLPLPPALARRMESDLRLLIESACDLAAARRFGSRQVARTLVRMQRLVQRNVICADNVRLAFTGSDIEARVHALLGRQPIRAPVTSVTIAALVLVCALSALLVDPLHHLAEWLLGI